MGKLEIFFGKFAIYIIAFLLGLFLFASAGWYVSNVRLESQTARADAVTLQLKTSNASYTSLKGTYEGLTKQLKDNSEQALINQQNISAELMRAIEASKPNQELEKQLLERVPTSQCATPEDLKNAWSKL